MNRGILLLFLLPLAGVAQIDQQRATEVFNEAKTLCEREGGKLWKIFLCGPIVIADPATKTIATNQPAPEATRPPALGFTNSTMQWGGTRWTAISWPSLVALRHVQGMLLIHELFHRIQPELGLLVPDVPSDHLDTQEGRYWMQLEWKALSRAIGATGQTRSAAVGDALAFRAARRSRFPGAAESERRFEINEGLAQYTATVVTAGTRSEAVRSAIEQLAKAPDEVTFVRQFAYPTGVAYGILLDEYAPGWTHRIKSGNDLGKLIEPFAATRPREELEGAAASYAGPEIRKRETRREIEHTHKGDSILNNTSSNEKFPCALWNTRMETLWPSDVGRVHDKKPGQTHQVERARKECLKDDDGSNPRFKRAVEQYNVLR